MRSEPQDGGAVVVGGGRSAGGGGGAAGSEDRDEAGEGRQRVARPTKRDPERDCHGQAVPPRPPVLRRPAGPARPRPPGRASSGPAAPGAEDDEAQVQPDAHLRRGRLQEAGGLPVLPQRERGGGEGWAGGEAGPGTPEPPGVGGLGLSRDLFLTGVIQRRWESWCFPLGSCSPLEPGRCPVGGGTG